MIDTTSAQRTGPSNSGSRRHSATPTAKNATAQSEFSIAFQRKLVVSTAYQEKHSATMISGTITSAAFTTVPAPVIVPSFQRRIAHCATKQTSAIVATERPITTLEVQ